MTNDPQSPEPSDKTSLGVSQNVEGALAYCVGWVTGIVFLMLEKDNKFVRFHAMQSIAVFVPLTVASVIVGYIPFIGGLLEFVLGAGTFILWIVLMIKAAQGEKYKLPVVGDFAESQMK